MVTWWNGFKQRQPRLLVMGLILGVLTGAPSWAQGSDPIRIVVDPWPPFGGSTLPEGGISLDVISTILTKAGYEVETSIVPWPRALDGVRNGSYDVIGNLFYNAPLAETLTFSAPFFETEVRFLQRKGADLSFTDLDSLRPHSIAVGAGYLYEAEFDAADYLNKTNVTEVIQGVRMVASGRVDLTLDSIDVLQYIIRKQAPELGGLVEILPNQLSVQEIHMAVRSDLDQRDALIADFNTILTQMRMEGTLNELLAKHRSN